MLARLAKAGDRPLTVDKEAERERHPEQHVGHAQSDHDPVHAHRAWPGSGGRGHRDGQHACHDDVPPTASTSAEGRGQPLHGREGQVELVDDQGREQAQADEDQRFLRTEDRLCSDLEELRRLDDRVHPGHGQPDAQDRPPRRGPGPYRAAVPRLASPARQASRAEQAAARGSARGCPAVVTAGRCPPVRSIIVPPPAGVLVGWARLLVGVAGILPARRTVCTAPRCGRRAGSAPGRKRWPDPQLPPHDDRHTGCGCAAHQRQQLRPRADVHAAWAGSCRTSSGRRSAELLPVSAQLADRLLAVARPDAQVGGGAQGQLVLQPRRTHHGLLWRRSSGTARLSRTPAAGPDPRYPGARARPRHPGSGAAWDGPGRWPPGTESWPAAAGGRRSPARAAPPTGAEQSGHAQHRLGDLEPEACEGPPGGQARTRMRPPGAHRPALRGQSAGLCGLPRMRVPRQTRRRPATRCGEWR